MNFADLRSGEAIFVDANTLIYHFTNHAKFGAPCTAPGGADRTQGDSRFHLVALPRGGRGGQDHREKGEYYTSTSSGKSGGLSPRHSETGRGHPRGRRLYPKPKALAVANVHPDVPEGDPGTPIVE